MSHLHPPPQHEHVSMHWRRTVKCVSVLLGGGAWSGLGCNTSRGGAPGGPAPGPRGFIAFFGSAREAGLCAHTQWLERRDAGRHETQTATEATQPPSANCSPRGACGVQCGSCPDPSVAASATRNNR
eukprot:5427345-Prymnesium_polylepis.1